MENIFHLRESHARRPRRRWSVKRLVWRLRAAWRRLLMRAVEQFPPDAPLPSPPLAKAAALREGALLSEYTDARSTRSVA